MDEFMNVRPPVCAGAARSTYALSLPRHCVLPTKERNSG
jgi:hypothetical protein